MDRPPWQPDEAEHLVVDALNVIGSRPDGWWRDRPGAVRRLADQLAPFAADHSIDLTVVIDGRPLEDLPEGRRGRLAVRYAPRPGPDAADDEIVALVAQLDAPACVVTADRDLRARVAALGASTIGPKALLDHLAGDQAEGPGSATL